MASAPDGNTGSDATGPRRTLPRNLLLRELQLMMYGFGDVNNPLPQSVAVMEELVLEYLTNLVSKTTAVAQSRRREKPDVTDVMFVIRKDPRKLQRVRYLQEMKKIVHDAKSMTRDGEVEKHVQL